MNGSNVFAALMLARALAGPEREPDPIPEPEFQPRPLAERVAPAPEREPDEAPAAAGLLSAG
jgi:hypothetical protein